MDAGEEYRVYNRREKKKKDLSGIEELENHLEKDSKTLPERQKNKKNSSPKKKLPHNDSLLYTGARQKDNQEIRANNTRDAIKRYSRPERTQ